MTIRPQALANIRPKKKWGQNFLTDKNIARAIVSLHNPKEDEIHLEIGPGTGQLTKLLLEKCKFLIAVEIDRRLVEALHQHFSDKKNLILLEQDILRTDFKEISSQYGLKERKFRIIGNIPFYISSPLLHHVIKFRQHIKDMTLMLQKEVAERIVAQPGNKDYGYISLMVRLYCNAEICFRIPRQSFYPKPQVEANIVRLLVLEKPRIDISDENFFLLLIKSCFSHRRKTLSNALAHSKLLPIGKRKIFMEIEKAGIEPKSRAESLSLEHFFQLYQQFIKFAKDL